MSVMDFFRSNGQQPPQQQAPKQEGANNNGQKANEPDPSKDPTKVEEPVNIGDKFKDLFSPVADDKKPKGFDPSELFSTMDPKSIQEAVSQMNFSGAVNKEILTKIQEGGEGATEALMQAMNNVAQQSFTQSMFASAEMIKGSLGKAMPHVDSKISDSLRRSKVSDSVKQANPATNHPAYQQMFKGLEDQLLLKHPEASPDEIAGMANEYMQGFMELAQGKKDTSNTTGKGETDWEELFLGNQD